jgi:hypothetical protein
MSIFPGQNLPPAILQEQWLNPWQNCKVVDLIPSMFFKNRLFSTLFKLCLCMFLSLYIYANANCGCVVCLVPVLCHSTPAKGVVVVAGIALGPVDPGTGRAGMNTVLENAGNRSVSAETPYHLQFFKSLSLFKFPRKERWSGSVPRFLTLSVFLCLSGDCPGNNKKSRGGDSPVRGISGRWSRFNLESLETRF